MHAVGSEATSLQLCKILSLKMYSTVVICTFLKMFSCSILRLPLLLASNFKRRNIATASSHASTWLCCQFQTSFCCGKKSYPPFLQPYETQHTWLQEDLFGWERPLSTRLLMLAPPPPSSGMGLSDETFGLHALDLRCRIQYCNSVTAEVKQSCWRKCDGPTLICH